MYLARLQIKNFRRFGDAEDALDLRLQPGVTALIGRNDAGKSAIIDAIRYVLLTRDHEYIRLQSEDFHVDGNGYEATEISITCTLAGLTDPEKGAFIEYLSYDDDGVVLHVNWVARRRSASPDARRWYDLDVRSGVDSKGPPFEGALKALLLAAYLRPLRDAEHEMSPGRGSRLSQVLFNVPGIKDGVDFDPDALPHDATTLKTLKLTALDDLMRYAVENHPAVSTAAETINQRYLEKLSLAGEPVRGVINTSEGGTETARLRQILERLQLNLLDMGTGTPRGRYGLGSNNLLFMACELLLLGTEPDGLPLLLIEEPEAHLHPQRQLRLMEFLTGAANGEHGGRPVQVVLTTHSPNLASKIPVSNLVLLDAHHAFSLAEDQTKLGRDDYRFLQRFLDATKANMFFAHALLIVEGDAEAILLPVLADLLGRNLTAHGVSIVNVGGTGLRRFSKIFQRADGSGTKIRIPVACVTDMDVLPDCAPEISGLVTGGEDPKWTAETRRWKALRDFGKDATEREANLAARRKELSAGDGQCVRTFVADRWTLEYDLAFCGLAAEVYVAGQLAKNDQQLNTGKKARSDIEANARTKFAALAKQSGGNDAVLSSHVYELFHSGKASKAVAAQYLAEILVDKVQDGSLNADGLRGCLPRYLVDAITYATSIEESTPVDGESGDGSGA